MTNLGGGGNFYKFREQMLWDAVNYAWKAHEGQTRADGKTPFIFHPLAVMMKTAEYTDMINTWIVALLHDVLEDTNTTYHEIQGLFGPEVAAMVDNLTKRPDQPYEDYIKDICNLGDRELIYVKLADNWHNQLTLDKVPDKDKRSKLNAKYIFAQTYLETALYRLSLN